MHATAALQTLASRRFALTARTPRQILVPLLTPIMFALVIAPALKEALGGLGSHIDYTACVAVGTVGLLVPLSAMFAGLSVIVDRDSGAQRELLAAPIPRGLLVLGNPGRGSRHGRAASNRADRRGDRAGRALPSHGGRHRVV